MFNRGGCMVRFDCIYNLSLCNSYIWCMSHQLCLSIIFNTNICKDNLFYYVLCTEEIWLVTIFRVRVSVRIMLLNATFHNISVISWWSVLLVEEKRSTPKKLLQNWQPLSHNHYDNVVSSTPRYFSSNMHRLHR